MSQEFIAVLDYMEKERGIKRELLYEAVHAALLAAARKSFGPARDLTVELDQKTGKIKAIARLLVVEKVTLPHDEISLPKARLLKPDAVLGDTVEVDVNTKDFGRIAAQVFKQAMNQTLRGIERSMVFDEFKDRMGAIVTGTVRRFERSDVIVDLGKFEAVMPARERVPTEEYTPGERIRAFVLAVENTPRGPEIILSRSHPNFVRKLFELEVSELNDKTIEIKAMAREAGYRTKIAVWSANEKVDPVGACVGMRGARVKNIVRELNNEKVDLFKWSPNIRELVMEALKPAKLKTLEVDEENLSLAIGRRGQNARLTQKLTGWDIDVKKEEEVAALGFEQKLAKATEALAQSLQIESDVAEKIVRAGFLSVEGIAEVDAEDLVSAVPDLDSALVAEIHKKAKNLQTPPQN